jgi:hypothetical protein
MAVYFDPQQTVKTAVAVIPIYEEPDHPTVLEVTTTGRNSEIFFFHASIGNLRILIAAIPSGPQTAIAHLSIFTGDLDLKTDGVSLVKSLMKANGSAPEILRAAG